MTGPLAPHIVPSQAVKFRLNEIKETSLRDRVARPPPLQELRHFPRAGNFAGTS